MLSLADAIVIRRSKPQVLEIELYGNWEPHAIRIDGKALPPGSSFASGSLEGDRPTTNARWKEANAMEIPSALTSVPKASRNFKR